MSSSMLPPITWCGGVLTLGLPGIFHSVRPAYKFGGAHPARLPQCPQNVVRQLREVSVLVSPEVPGFRPLPFNHVLLVSGLRASCSTSRGSWLLPLTPWHPLPAPCPRAPGEQGVPAASMSQGIRTGPQLSPGVGGRARCPTSHTLAHALPHLQ